MAKASTPPSSSPLPSSHPLILELTSLRAQLSQYQRTFHQTSIQLQGSKLELTLCQNENARLIKALDSVKSEVDILRNNPTPAPIPPQSTALSELSLAHRKLSAKLDLTEDALRGAQLELASAKAELAKLQKEKENDVKVIEKLRKAEDEYGTSISKERGERKIIEEQKKLCDLALSEYSTLVHSLDPNAILPTSNHSNSSSPPNILNSTPTLSSSSSVPSPSSPISPSGSKSAANALEDISNLLIGQQGVQRLLDDCTEILNSRDSEIRKLGAHVQELLLSRTTLEDSLQEEITLRVASQAERDATLRDDAAAAKVVERYMTFTQKTHATIHAHLDNMRIRAGATQNTLRKEIKDVQKALREESVRGERIKDACHELSEGLARESAGRRREIALRLTMIAEEEVRDRKVEKWIDRVRISRQGPEGSMLDATALEVLLDEGLKALGTDLKPVSEGNKRWKVWGGDKRKGATSARDKEGESLARILLAEELVHSLVEDLQRETERRLELEKQRVDWLAREAVEGVNPDQGEDGVGQSIGMVSDGEALFEIGDDFDGPTPSPGPASPEDLHRGDPALLNLERAATSDSSPLVEELRSVFHPLDEQSEPLVKSLHDLSHSLISIRKSIPDRSGTPLSSPVPQGRPKFLNLKKVPPGLADPLLINLLDSLHEVIEDARVDIEISRADEERVYRGLEALISVGVSGAVRGHAVLSDAREYVNDRIDNQIYEKLKMRIEDLESDLSTIKQKVIELEGGIIDLNDTGDDQSTLSDTIQDNHHPWGSLDLKTISTSTFTTRTSTPLGGISSIVTTPLSALSFGSNISNSSDLNKPSTFSMVGNMGRSFSAGVISAPRKVGGLALASGMNLKRVVTSGKGDTAKVEEKGLMDEENDVE